MQQVQPQIIASINESDEDYARRLQMMEAGFPVFRLQGKQVIIIY